MVLPIPPADPAPAPTFLPKADSRSPHEASCGDPEEASRDEASSQSVWPSVRLPVSPSARPSDCARFKEDPWRPTGPTGG
eukprot:15434985-Alexandrium_andersonii.AAC.1